MYYFERDKEKDSVVWERYRDRREEKEEKEKKKGKEGVGERKAENILIQT